MAQSTQNDVSSLLQPVDDNTPYLHTDEVTSPTTRQPYRRHPSWQGTSARYQHVQLEDHGIAEELEEEDDIATRGLGLSNVPKSASSSVVKRVPVGSRTSSTSPYSPEITRSAEPFSQTTTARNTEEISNNTGKWTTPNSSHFSLNDNIYRHTADDVNLIPRAHNHEHNHDYDAGCPTQGDLLRERWTWLTWMIIILAVYSTIFSALFLGISIAKPRYGHKIGTQGAMSYDTATFLSALFSKTVELSFATTFVATLGQILSRRAFTRSSDRQGGISIAEMNMRLWIMQPGTLVTHWVGIKYVIKTVIGVIALLAAFAATFYTTAAEALVSPKLKFGPRDELVLHGQVSAGYANSIYLSKHCETPITNKMDQLYRGTTCLQLDYAGNAFRNVASWRSSWAERQATSLNDDAGRDVERPPPISILYENTTVHGKWVTNLYNDIEKDSMEHGRLFQNVTMVMPHVNVYHAARDRLNRVLQPDDLHGSGEFYIQAAVPSPALNVLCVGATEDELTPLVGNATHPPLKWPVTTPFDEWFGWVDDPKTTSVGEETPRFGKLPINYNTVVNSTTNWGPEWIYLLAKSDPAVVDSANPYTLCGIRSYQYLDCSTSLHETKSGGELSVQCGDDPNTWKKYSDTRNSTIVPPGASLPAKVDAKNWKDIGMEWVNSVSLGQGISDGNASIARFLTQSVPAYKPETGAKLMVNFPSIAEGISVLAGYTLLMASDTAPFVHWWQYSAELEPILDPPQLQSFEARLAYKDYASGYDQNWKGIFYVILFVVFALNIFCLATLLWYFIHYGEVTDYTEPQNLFALAINSPRSQFLAGACGSGPTGEVLGKKWCVEMSHPSSGTPDPNADHNPGDATHVPGSFNRQSTMPTSRTPHFYVRYPEEGDILLDTAKETAANIANDTPNTQARGNNRFSRVLPSPTKLRHATWGSPQTNKRQSRMSQMLRPKSTFMEEMEFEDAQSPVVTQYMKLTGGRG